MSLALLQNIWYFVICASVVLYTILDGFDLGVGSLHLFAQTDKDRRIFLNAIGPVWDGNEVWLVVVGGALFAGFPDAYASIFSGFYNLLMFFLAGIIFRAVAIEFRSKQKSTSWRKFWDGSFCIASTLIAMGLGVVLGNLIKGVPVNADGNFSGTFLSFLSPYSVVVGLLALTLFTMHGNIYLLMKTEGDIHDYIRTFLRKTVGAFVVMYLAATIMTFIYVPHMIERMLDHKWAFIFPVCTFLSIVNIFRMVKKGYDGWAFISSSLSIALLFVLFGIGTYPIILRSTLDTSLNSMTLYNSSSSRLTLKVLLLIAGMGVPLVLAYGVWIYRIFRGKVHLEETSY
ncbi:MAG: cytochrome d ubiquinol oxidase subunit II [Simkaniaceae bacterium]